METVLIVDDDKSIRYSLKRMMEGSYAVFTAQNGEEALERVVKDPPDLVVMDAIRILTTNGPKGPGKTEDIGEVIASTDIVAADAYAASFFKNPKTGKPFKPEEIKFVKHAYDMGLGQIDLSKVKMKKVTAT